MCKGLKEISFSELFRSLEAVWLKTLGNFRVLIDKPNRTGDDTCENLLGDQFVSVS